jgi:hypothetical protein
VGVLVVAGEAVRLGDWFGGLGQDACAAGAVGVGVDLVAVLVRQSDETADSGSDGPFGRALTFADPYGYQITVHDHAACNGNRL